MAAITEFFTDLANLLEIDQAMLTDDFNFSSTTNWDSLTIVSTIALLDQYFNIKTEGIVIEKCHTVKDLNIFIDEHKEI